MADPNEKASSSPPPQSGIAESERAPGAVPRDADLRMKLAARIAHDVNNALAVVVALASSTADASADEEAREDARTILQAAERIGELMTKLSALAKGKAVDGLPAVLPTPPIGGPTGVGDRNLPNAGGVLVVVVDDEVVVAKSAGRLLERYGFRAAVCTTAQQAYEALAAGAPGRRCLLTDVVMPEVSGVELALEARRRLPDLPVLLMSGYTGNVDVAASGLECIEKPFDGRTVAERLIALVGASAAEEQER